MFSNKVQKSTKEMCKIKMLSSIWEKAVALIAEIVLLSVKSVLLGLSTCLRTI